MVKLLYGTPFLKSNFGEYICFFPHREIPCFQKGFPGRQISTPNFEWLHNNPVYNSQYKRSILYLLVTGPYLGSSQTFYNERSVTVLSHNRQISTPDFVLDRQILTPKPTNLCAPSGLCPTNLYAWTDKSLRPISFYALCHNGFTPYKI